MKKTLTFALFALLSVIGLSLNAQTYTGKSASTTLNVNLDNAYNIEIGQSSVSINMNSSEHYVSGNSSGNQYGHVVVGSTSGYEVKVSAASELLNGAAAIPVSTVTVRPQLGAYGGGGPAPTVTDLNLTDTSLEVGVQKTIISKDSGESKRSYDIDYAIFARHTAGYLNKTPGTYTTTVTYSLYAK